VSRDPIAGPESAVEEMAGQAGHRGVKFGLSHSALDRQDSRFCELLFGLVVQEVTHVMGSFYGRGAARGSGNGLGARYGVEDYAGDASRQSPVTGLCESGLGFVRVFGYRKPLKRPVEGSILKPLIVACLPSGTLCWQFPFDLFYSPSTRRSRPYSQK
jgi:hypothetical protein